MDARIYQFRGRQLTLTQQRLVWQTMELSARFARAMASRPGARLCRDELFAIGCLALVEAACRFDAKGGVPFDAYAVAAVHRAMSEALEHERRRGRVIDIATEDTLEMTGL